MGRSKLRAVRMAGVKMAIEVPSSLDWDWPDRKTESLSCSPFEPDVHIGIRIGQTVSSAGETFLYESYGSQFEIGWEGETWVVAIHGPDGADRVARFDSDFRFGEIVISPEFAEGSQYPLLAPLDELLLLHRLIREGCMILRGSVSTRGGKAFVFLNSPSEAGRGHARQRGLGHASEYVVLRPELKSSDSRRSGVWLEPTPWGDAPDARRLPLAAIHIVGSGGDQPAERLTGRAAQDEILQHAFAPVHDSVAIDRLAEVVGHVVRKTSILKMNRPQMRRSLRFDWNSPGSGMGFAAPSA